MGPARGYNHPPPPITIVSIARQLTIASGRFESRTGDAGYYRPTVNKPTPDTACKPLTQRKPLYPSSTILGSPPVPSPNYKPLVEHFSLNLLLGPTDPLHSIAPINYYWAS